MRKIMTPGRSAGFALAIASIAGAAPGIAQDTPGLSNAKSSAPSFSASLLFRRRYFIFEAQVIFEVAAPHEYHLAGARSGAGTHRVVPLGWTTGCVENW